MADHLRTDLDQLVPQRDHVVATGPGMVTVPIQVKASNGTNWQTSLDQPEPEARPFYPWHSV